MNKNKDITINVKASEPTGLVTNLRQNEIFVFGSNESGKHGKGAAKTAMKWGAVYGQAEGLQGQTYGIPTKDKRIEKTLSLSKIQKYVDNFVDFAKSRQDLIFLVTEIGCGLAGLSPEDVAPLFADVLKLHNVRTPSKFIDILLRND